MLVINFIILEKVMNSFPPYRPIRTIGSGVFGFVFEAENRNTKEKVAIKRLERIGKQLSREYQVLQMIQGCQNIIKLEDFFISINKKGKIVQNLVFQYIDDNLQNIIQKHAKAKTKILEKDAKSYLYQLLKALDYIHDKNIAHRDLKPQNILISKNGILKLCDFGSSKIIDPNGKNTPYIVSRYYRAPQLILSITKYGTEIDMWSVGCIMAEMFLLRPFFHGKTEGDQIFEILNILGQFSPAEIKQYTSLITYDAKIFEQISGYYKEDLDGIFSMVEDKKNFIDLLERMLCYRQSKRIKAKEALRHSFFSDFHKNEKLRSHKYESQLEVSTSASKSRKK